MKAIIIILIFIINCSTTKEFILGDDKSAVKISISTIEKYKDIDDKSIEINWRIPLLNFVKKISNKYELEINNNSTFYNAHFANGKISINKAVILHHQEMIEKGNCGELDLNICKNAMLAFLILHEIRHGVKPEERKESVIDTDAAEILAELSEKKEFQGVSKKLFYSSLEAIKSMSGNNNNRGRNYDSIRVRICNVQDIIEKKQDCDYKIYRDLNHAFAAINNTQYVESTNNLSNAKRIIEKYIKEISGSKDSTNKKSMLKELRFIHCVAETKEFALEYYKDKVGLFSGISFSENQVYESVLGKEKKLTKLIALYKKYFEDFNIDFSKIKEYEENEPIYFHQCINFALLLDITNNNDTEFMKNFDLGFSTHDAALNFYKQKIKRYIWEILK